MISWDNMKKLYVIMMQHPIYPQMLYRGEVIAENLVTARQMVQEKCPDYRFCWFGDFFLPEDQK